MLPVSVAGLSSDNSYCVLLVLWITSCFPVMGHMARGVDSIDVGAVLTKVVKIVNVFARGHHDV